jgi:hypothetical protein
MATDSHEVFHLKMLNWKKILDEITKFVDENRIMDMWYVLNNVIFEDWITFKKIENANLEN